MSPAARGMIRNTSLGAMCLALCMVLPFVTGQIPQIGAMLCPMHLPVLLCGFICGPWYALIIGAAAPLLRFAIFGMPPVYPTGIAMCFELMTYGLVSGLLYKLLPKNKVNIWVSLLAAMLAGRLVWGCVRAVISGAGGAGFTWAAFISGGFTSAVPGIVLQLVLIPAVVLALRKARLMD